MFCTDIPAPFLLIFSESTPQLLYYSHLPAVFTALVLGLLVLGKDKGLASKLFFATVFCFAIWNLIDLVNWTNVDSRRIMLGWSLMNFFSIMVAATTLYFSYVFLEKKKVPFKAKLLGAGVILPLLLLSPTDWNLNGFNMAVCEAVQGPLINYFYFLQIFFLVWIAGYLILAYRRSAPARKKQVLTAALGIFFFIVTFFGGTFIGSVTLHWEWEQYGLFGMFFFISFMLYLIVRYQAFNMKLFGSQVLIAALVILIGSQLLFTDDVVNIILIGITWVLITLLGLALIRSVKEEIKRKEQLQNIAHELEVANEELRKLDNAKTEFLSIASHQLRTPLTAMKGYLSLLLEGSYGKLTPEVEDVLNKVYLVNTRLSRLVEELLNVSRIDAGRVQYNFERTRLEPILKELVDTFAINAKERGLDLTLELPRERLPLLELDQLKIKEVISNLIDNALKYTKKGSVTVRVKKLDHAVEVAIEDTGIGIAPEMAGKLFEKFSRSRETAKIEVSGTGLGLYVGKKFVEAHGGTIRAQSKGKDQGTRFVVTLPLSGKYQKP